MVNGDAISLVDAEADPQSAAPSQGRCSVAEVTTPLRAGWRSGMERPADSCRRGDSPGALDRLSPRIRRSGSTRIISRGGRRAPAARSSTCETGSVSEVGACRGAYPQIMSRPLRPRAAWAALRPPWPGRSRTPRARSCRCDSPATCRAAADEAAACPRRPGGRPGGDTLAVLPAATECSGLARAGSAVARTCRADVHGRRTTERRWRSLPSCMQELAAALPERSLPAQGLLLIFVAIEPDGGFPSGSGGRLRGVVPTEGLSRRAWPRLPEELRYDPALAVAEPSTRRPTGDPSGSPQRRGRAFSRPSVRPSVASDVRHQHDQGARPFQGCELLLQFDADALVGAEFGDGGVSTSGGPRARRSRHDHGCLVDMDSN